MKQLNNKIYENLGTRERIIASVEANARNDDNEVQRLINTCPKKHYTGNDRAYSQRMDYLFTIQMAIECDLTGHALSYALTSLREVETKTLTTIKEHALQSFIDTHTAWQEFLHDNGINLETINKIIEPMRHPYIDSMLNRLQTPNRDQVKINRDIIDRAYNRNV